MILVVALNNPGKEYEHTAHNIGLDVLLSFLSEYKINLNNFKFEKKFNSLILKYKLFNKDILFAIPNTYMNNSGIAVSQIKNFYKIENENIIVLHDEYDLNAGIIKIQKNKNHAGHNGIKSIIEFLKTKNFIRIRIGIKTELAKYMLKEKFVLHKFNKTESKNIQKSINKAKNALKILLEKNLVYCQNHYK